MPERYTVPCDCGTRLRVELFDAGVTKRCPACGAGVRVPDSVTLKESAGDPYPLLRPFEKVALTAERGEPPFDGSCHGCGTAPAAWAVPVTFEVMEERQVADHGGVRPSLTGVTLVAAAAEERWRSLTFPLLLCDDCLPRYRASRRTVRRRGVLKSAALLGLLAAFLYCVYANFEAVAALSGVLSLVGAAAWAVGRRGPKADDRALLAWLGGVRWVPEMVAAEDECRLTAAEPRAIPGS